MKTSKEIIDIEEEEFKAWNGHEVYYMVQVLNGEKTISEFKEDLLSFRNSEYYTGTNKKYKLTNI